MARYQVQTADGQTFEVEAPNEDALKQAVSALPHKAPTSLVRRALEPFTSFFPNQTAFATEGLRKMKEGVSTMFAPAPPPAPRDEVLGPSVASILGGPEGVADAERRATGLGEAALGALEYVGSYPNAFVHSFVGQPFEEDFGIPSQYSDLAASLALPIPKGLPRFARAAPARVAAPDRVMDVALSEGQATRNLSNIQREQAALRGTSGPPAQAAAQAFADQQAGELAAARERLARSLDAHGSGEIDPDVLRIMHPGASAADLPTLPPMARTPQQAGELVQRGVQGAEQAAKSAVDTAYKAARQLPGEIHADVFRAMPQDIKTELSAGDEPVIIDDKLTPFAAQMMKDLDTRVGQLRIQNRAQPGSRATLPAGEDAPIVGVTLKGVEQIRRRLSTMRGDAMVSGNPADARAARAVLKSFDERIDAAVDSGAFNGDARAVAAWKAARAQHSDFRGLFREGRNDPVGRVVERIVGAAQAPERLPGNVADYLGGASSSGLDGQLNAAVARRLRTILGDRSPEWSAVRQGLLARLIERPEGVKDFGPGQVANRIGEFLNGKGRPIAQAVYSPADQQLLRNYADLMRHIEVPQAGANWSNTATFAGQAYRPSVASRALAMVGSNVGKVVGAVLGHVVAPGMGGEIAGAVTAHVAGVSGQAMEARTIARMMPVIGSVTRTYARAARVAEISPTARNVARLTLAAKNLSTNLQTIGVAMSPDDLLRALQGPTPAQGGQNKQ